MAAMAADMAPVGESAYSMAYGRNTRKTLMSTPPPRPDLVQDFPDLAQLGQILEEEEEQDDSSSSSSSSSSSEDQ